MTKTNYAMFTDEGNAAVAAAVDAHPTPTTEDELREAGLEVARKVQVAGMAHNVDFAEVWDTAVGDEIYIEFVRRMNPADKFANN